MQQGVLKNIEWVELQSASNIFFRSWAALYHRRFPYSERAPISALADAINDGESIIIGLKGARSIEWASFAHCEFYSQGVLLAYLATAENFEGQGLARKTIQQAETKFLTEQSPYFWLEAAPKLWPFYQKLGYTRLDLPYQIPNYHDDGSEKMALFIKLHPSVSVLTKSTLHGFIKETFLQGYGLHEEDTRYLWQQQQVDNFPEEAFLRSKNG